MKMELKVYVYNSVEALDIAAKTLPAAIHHVAGMPTDAIPAEALPALCDYKEAYIAINQATMTVEVHRV